MGPKAGYGNHNFHSVVANIAFVAGVVDIVVDSINNGAVAVNFFEGNFPFVVAFLAVHSNHGVECGTAVKAQFFGVFDGFGQVAVAVKEQVFGHVFVFGSQVKG